MINDLLIQQLWNIHYRPDTTAVTQRRLVCEYLIGWSPLQFQLAVLYLAPNRLDVT